MRISKVHLAIICLISANIIWGLTPAVNKWSLESIPPYTLAFLRFLIASLVLLPFTIHRLHINKKDIVFIAFLAFMGFNIHIGTLLKGLTLASALNLTVFIAATPLLIVIGGVIYLKEKLTTRLIVGSAVSLIGVVIITISSALNGEFSSSLYGNLLFLIGTIAFVVYTLLVKPIENKYSLLTLSFWLLAFTTIFFTPLVYFELREIALAETLNYKGVFGILWGALAASLIAFLAYNYALKYLKASSTGIYLYITPAVAIMASVVLLNEKLSVNFIIGAVLVFIGIAVSQVHIHLHKHHSKIKYH